MIKIILALLYYKCLGGFSIVPLFVDALPLVCVGVRLRSHHCQNYTHAVSYVCVSSFAFVYVRLSSLAEDDETLDSSLAPRVSFSVAFPSFRMVLSFLLILLLSPSTSRCI